LPHRALVEDVAPQLPADLIEHGSPVGARLRSKIEASGVWIHECAKQARDVCCGPVRVVKLRPVDAIKTFEERHEARLARKWRARNGRRIRTSQAVSMQ